jgi:hypothetical protein
MKLVVNMAGMDLFLASFHSVLEIQPEGVAGRATQEELQGKFNTP